MKLHVLGGDTPLIKHYELTSRNELKQTSYPAVSRFTSFEYEINNLEDFYTVITEHAAAGNCLIKGELQRPLHDESRAGATSPETPTSWICLDLDGIQGFSSVDEILRLLGCADTSYILQWSASYGLNASKSTLRCHIFMLLEEPQHPAVLKRWLRSINLSGAISSQTSLAKSHNALKWPIDVTTCQNDKLLYIAPPRFGENVLDPCADTPRISLVRKTYHTLGHGTFSGVPDAASIETWEFTRLNELRVQAGLKPRKAYKYAVDADTQYLKNPDAAQITGVKSERGFVYFNLNGGDSWGYYHPVSHPGYIHNFKGEPIYRTQDLLPDYWEDIKTRVQNMEPDAGGQIYLAFRDFETATYWNGIYDSTQDTLVRLAAAKSESQLRHFMKQHGQPLGDYIPDWDMEFDPHKRYTVDRAAKRINTFIRPQHFRFPAIPTAEVPPLTRYVIHHVVGGDDECYEHMLNWLAVIVQNLTMTQTAWVLHGTQGTGKGVFFNYILTPLFGEHNVTSRRMEELGSDFTEFMKNKFIVFIDEAQTGTTLYHERITAKLKNLIVEPRISVREMYRPSTIMPNYTNLIFASNHTHPVVLSPDDRRFNIAVYQREKIRLTRADIRTLQGETNVFYGYLATRAIDAHRARTPIQTADRLRLINSSRPALDIAVEALKCGEMSFFQDLLVEKTESLSFRAALFHDQYKALLEEIWANQRTRLTREDLHILFRWIGDRIPDSPNKFSSLLRHHGLELKPLWINGKATRGFDVGEWKNANTATGDYPGDTPSGSTEPGALQDPA